MRNIPSYELHSANAMAATKSTDSPAPWRCNRNVQAISSHALEIRDIHLTYPVAFPHFHFRSRRMKYRTRRPLSSLAITGSSLVVVALMLPACGSDAEIVFPTSSTSGSSSSGDGGANSGGQGGNGQGGASSSSGQGGQGGNTGGQGGSAGQSSSSSSSGMPTTEDCLDGLDNDADGSIDCADADCTTGFTCTDEPPSGWTSVALEEGMGAPPTPMPCASGDMPESLYTGPAGPAECSMCMCGNLTGTTCNPPQLLCFPGSQSCNANNQDDWTGDFGNNSCAKPDIGFSISLSCRLGNAASVNQPGNCGMPSPSDFPNKDTWAGWLQACAIKATGGGCGTGKVCAPNPTATQSLCIRQDGQQACPNGWKAVEGYADGKDDRSCGACSCTANPTCTGGTYQVFDSNNCDTNGGNPTTIDSNTCRNVSGQIDFGSWSVQRNPPTAGGTCAASGGEPQGSVQTQGPVTFCCK
jgi:hypothetical protein